MHFPSTPEAEATRAHSVAPSPRRAAHAAMDPWSLIVLALCVASAQSSDTESLRPLQQVIKSRSDAYGSYANDFTKEYEPIAYAALPLHKPMPVIAILSEKPITQYAASYKQLSYSKPDNQNYVETEYQSNKEDDTEDDKPFSSSEYQKPFSNYRKPNVEYQKPYVEHQKQYAEYQEPYAEYQKPYPEYGQKLQYTEYEKPYAEYQKPYVKYQKQYAEYQKPYVQYQKPYVEYQKPYVVESPKYAPIEYAKPYPEEVRAYAPVEYVKPYSPIEYRPAYEHIKPYASVEAPTILYARPSESGGYSYHRRPQKKRNVKRPRKEKPVIIRVHKYRVIRSRRSYPELSYKPRTMA